jgi:hypothetical protein
MLIVALVLAVIGLAALVTAVVTSNEIVAWVCIGASGLGVLLLVVDAVRDRARRGAMVAPGVSDVETAAETAETVETGSETEVIEPEESTEVAETVEAEIADEDHPEEVVHDEPDFDLPSDDEQEFPESAEEAAIHIVDEDDLAAENAEEVAAEDEAGLQESAGEAQREQP